MKKSIFKSLTFAGIGSFCAFATNAGTSLFSDYGQIQNVQNYSSNPFWTPNAPYNQRLSQPVYVQGADLNTDDCIRAVQSLISVQCMARNNCKNTALNEIRPEIMVQLSKLPGNNYVSACSGYIDSVFESYVAQHGNNAPNRVTAFPSATTPNQNTNENTGLQLKNPYKQTTTKAQQAVNERSAELQRLQQQNGAGSEHLSSTEFPKTFEDLSFAQRVAFKAEDYEQYKGSKTYAELNPIGADEWCNDHPNTPECRAWRDCTEEMKKTVSHLVRAEYDDKRICRVVQCETGWVPNQQKDTCIEAQGTDCTAKAQEFDPHVTLAQIDANGICKIIECEKEPSPGYVPNSTGTACEEVPVSPDPNPDPDPAPKDCMDQVTNTEHVVGATINPSTGKCEVICDTGYQPSPDKLSCESDILPPAGIRIALMFAPDSFVKPVGTVVKPEDLPKSYFFDSDCSDHKLAWNISNTAAINKTVRSLLGNDDNYFLDMPVNEYMTMFPGLLEVGTNSWRSWRARIGSEDYKIVIYRDLAEAKEIQKTLASMLDNSKCGGLNLYLVALDVDKTTSPAKAKASRLGDTFFDNGVYSGGLNIRGSLIKEVITISEPIKIQQ